MRDVLIIKERFELAGLGKLYTVENNKGAVVNIGDIYFDLSGNQFVVKSIERLRRISNDLNYDEIPIGLLLQSLNQADVVGNILIRNMKEISFLFCNHPLYKNKVDEDYKEEYLAAGLEYSCALVSYEDLEQGKLSLYGEELSGLTIYRGWMMKPEMYRKFYSMLKEKNIILINSPDEYERYHLLPGWYEDYREYTSFTVWEQEGKLENAINMAKNLEGAYIVKDYVKSRKHEWYNACFISNITLKENAQMIISNFINRQGDSLVGGVVLRHFEKLKQIGYHEQSGMPLSEEYRVFIYAGKVMIITDYWSEKEIVLLSQEELDWIEQLASGVKSNFVTMDIARKEDGELLIMEFGDGQVSGLQQIKPNRFYSLFNK